MKTDYIAIKTSIFNKVLFNYQFGFRHNHAATLALIDVVDNLYENLDKQNKVIGIYLDLQKAFNTVKHDMLHKLHTYGICRVLNE